ncbi:MAG: ABC transporter permease [Synergistaceae bacterium]|nr:ABC transporter permease [Synergistaceae bacterium]
MTELHETKNFWNDYTKKTVRRYLFLFFGGVLVFIILSVSVDKFFTPYNIFNIITQASIYGTMAVGLAFVLITGGIDISLPPVMAAGAVVGITYMSTTGDWLVGCLIVIMVCLLAGLINGVAVAVFNMPPMIVTLAMMSVAQGFATWYTNYDTVIGIPKILTSFFRSYVWVIPVYSIAFLVIVVVSQFVLGKTVYGRWLYFVGTSRNASVVTGVPVRFTVIIAYLISSLTAALAGIMLSTQIGSAQARMGPQSMVLDILSSAVIGGASDRGGRGTIIGVAIGALIIALTSNVMNLLGLKAYPALVIKGVIIILATFMDYTLNKSKWSRI